MRKHIEDCRMLMHCDIALNLLALFAYQGMNCDNTPCYVALHYWIKFTYLPTASRKVLCGLAVSRKP